MGRLLVASVTVADMAGDRTPEGRGVNPPGQGRPVLYLAWEETGTVDAAAEGPWEDAVQLRPGLLLLDSEATRSEVYHALKHHLPRTAALLVAPLADAPKMKGMADGSTTWLRSR